MKVTSLITRGGHQAINLLDNLVMKIPTPLVSLFFGSVILLSLSSIRSFTQIKYYEAD